MKKTKLVLFVCALAAISLVGCASTELAYYDFADERMAVDARIDPDADVDASYSVVVDPNDPVRTAISIGSSLAKAGQVREARAKLYAALEEVDIREIVEAELSEYVEVSLGTRVVEQRSRASLHLLVDIESYGLDAGGSGIDFALSAKATLWDADLGERIWRRHESVSEPVSPEVFGLPGSAGNVLSAVMLAELSEKEMERGLERLARDAAWDIGQRLERDIYRARRRR